MFALEHFNEKLLPIKAFVRRIVSARANCLINWLQPSCGSSWLKRS